MSGWKSIIIALLGVTLTVSLIHSKGKRAGRLEAETAYTQQEKKALAETERKEVQPLISWRPHRWRPTRSATPRIKRSSANVRKSLTGLSIAISALMLAVRRQNIWHSYRRKLQQC